MSGNIHKTPLTPAVFHILLALAKKEMHGYGIIKQISIDSFGQINMGPGTLYGSISRMLDAGLIQEAAAPNENLDDSRRIYYSLTNKGTNLLKMELERYENIVNQAQKLKLSFLKS